MARDSKANPPHESRTSPLHRVTLQCGPHHWGFSFHAPDAGRLLRRLDELSADPDCPLETKDAESIRHQILERIRCDARSAVT